MALTRSAQNLPTELVDWPEASVAPALPAGEIHLWWANLDLGAETTAGFRRFLAPGEVARAGRYRRAIDRDRFAVARGTLSVLLGRYLARDPAALRFQYICACGRPDCPPEQRKPTLNPASSGDWLHFNVSHAEGLALYALARATCRRRSGIVPCRSRPNRARPYSPRRARVGDTGGIAARGSTDTILSAVDSQGSVSQGARRRAQPPAQADRTRNGRVGRTQDRQRGWR